MDLVSSSRKGLVRRASGSPWMVVTVGLWLQCSTGGVYDFGIYSESIKESLGLTQQALDSISVSKDIGANVGVLSGLLYDYFPTWTVLASAAAFYLVGNLMMWLSITSRVPTPPLWLACLYALLAGNAQTLSNTAVVVTCLKIFPNNRGTIVGLMKGSLGIGGAVLVQLYYAVFGSEQEDFPLLMACLVPTLCVGAMFVIRPLSLVENRDQKRWLNMFSAIVSTLSAYLLGVIILQSCVSLRRSWRIAIFAGITLILFSPMWVVVRSELDTEVYPKTFEERGNLLVSENNSLEESEALKQLELSGSSAVVQENTKPRRGENFSLLQAMLSLDFWLLFFASACGMGSGLTTINNMSQLGLSLGYTADEISTFVSLWSIWNFFGRFGAGYISELYFQSKGVPRPLFIVISLGVMVSGHVIIALALPGALYIGPILVGACYGAQWSLMPSTASELFGLKNFGAIFNTISVASPLSSYILSVKVTGYLYDLEAKKGMLGRLWYILSVSSCNGAHCFRLSFLIMAGVCMAGSCVSVFLFCRTRNFYKAQMRWPRYGAMD